MRTSEAATCEPHQARDGVPAETPRLRLAITANDARAKFLFESLKRLADVRTEVDFDDIDPLTKYGAALLSYARPRAEWWGNYQMHPLVQARRRRVLQRGLGSVNGELDALIMWGSWFHPTRGRSPNRVPFFHYIDQSRSLAPLPEEEPATILRREHSFALQAETYRDSSGIFCMSEWARAQTLDAHSVSAEKVSAVGWGPCAIDLSGEDIVRSPTDAPVVLHISNDFYRKGIDYLAATAERLRESHPDARFVVIGRDASHAHVDAGPNVEFLGPIYDRRVLTEHFRRATVFFLPHRFDRSPHVLVEAMSAGLPLVASAQGGPIELIEGRGTGVCVAPGDIDGYAAALRGMLGDRLGAARTGRRGRELMRTYYNWDSVAQRILSRVGAVVAPRTAVRTDA
jgi:glycosyltransferase involved in cell wall biosynthesis